MANLTKRQLLTFRQQLAGLQCALDPATWQRTDSLLRKAALGIALTDVEERELRALLIDRPQEACQEESGQADEAQKHRHDAENDSASYMAVSQVLRADNERPMRIEWSRHTAKRLPRR